MRSRQWCGPLTRASKRPINNRPQVAAWLPTCPTRIVAARGEVMGSGITSGKLTTITPAAGQAIAAAVFTAAAFAFMSTSLR